MHSLHSPNSTLGRVFGIRPIRMLSSVNMRLTNHPSRIKCHIMKKIMTNKKSFSALMSFLLCMVLSVSAVGQQGNQVTGQVTDTKGSPLPGVTVVVKGTTNGTQTDGQGRYSLDINTQNPILVFSFIGMQSKELPVGQQSTLNATLKESAVNLDEVVAIGYGSVKKGNLTGAVSTLTANDIKDRPVSRIGQAMEGKMPGVVVRTTTGTPGAALQIRVRGSASITAGNDPLYVLDGVPVSDLGDINPDDIASIEVLKDAASAAIYGSRGSNGVVLITTKKGTPGKTQIHASLMYGWQTPEHYINMLSPSEWIDLNRQVKDLNWVNHGKNIGQPYKASDPQAFRMQQLGITSPSQSVNYMYDPRWQYGTDSLDFINWQKAFFNTAPIQQYQLSASGGSDNITYRISGDYLDQDGLAVYSGYKVFSFRSNLEARLNNFIKVGLNLSPSMSKSFGAGVDGRSGLSATVAGMTPVAEKGTGLMTGVSPYPTYAWGGSQVSPVEIMKQTLNQTDRIRILSSIYTDVSIVKGLDVKVTGAWNFNSSDNKYYQPTDVTSRNGGKAPGSASSGSRRTSRSMYGMFESLLTYAHDWNKHHIDLLLGYTAEQTNDNNTYQRNQKFPNDDLYTFDQGTSTVINSSNGENEVTLLSYLGRLQYNYNDRYLFSASLRRDGSSKFGANNKWGYFPSLSGAWRVSQESFMEPLNNIFSDLKIKYSWGETGNNGISDYAAIGTIGSYNYDYNGQVAIGYGPSSFSNPDLKWEKTLSSNVGIDMGFIQNRLYISANYYHKTTTNLLLNVPIAQSTGFNQSLQNIGSVVNQGFELSVDSRNMVDKDFKWETAFNISYNQNKITKLGNQNTPIFTGWGQTVEMKVGEPLVSYVLYDAIGVYKDQKDVDNSPHMTNTIPGDPKYRDVNGDEKIDENDITIVGHPDPKFVWGFTNTFTFKRFDLSIFLQGQWGGKIFSMFGRNIDRPTPGLANYNAIGKFRNRWRSPEEPGDGKTPRIDASTASLYDTRWLYNDAFWKIRNITIGYNLPAGIIKGLNSARIYFSTESPFMKDHYTGGYSPEAWQDDYYSDYSSYPTAKVFSFGLNVSL